MARPAPLDQKAKECESLSPAPAAMAAPVASVPAPTVPAPPAATEGAATSKARGTMGPLLEEAPAEAVRN